MSEISSIKIDQLVDKYIYLLNELEQYFNQLDEAKATLTEFTLQLPDIEKPNYNQENEKYNQRIQ